MTIEQELEKAQTENKTLADSLAKAEERANQAGEQAKNNFANFQAAEKRAIDAEELAKTAKVDFEKEQAKVKLLEDDKAGEPQRVTNAINSTMAKQGIPEPVTTVETQGKNVPPATPPATPKVELRGIAKAQAAIEKSIQRN